MFVVNVPKDLVFSFLEKGFEVYAFDYKQECVSNLHYEPVNEILRLLTVDYVVYFVVQEEKEGK